MLEYTHCFVHWYIKSEFSFPTGNEVEGKQNRWLDYESHEMLLILGLNGSKQKLQFFWNSESEEATIGLEI